MGGREVTESGVVEVHLVGDVIEGQESRLLDIV